MSLCHFVTHPHRRGDLLVASLLAYLLSSYPISIFLLHKHHNKQLESFVLKYNHSTEHNLNIIITTSSQTSCCLARRGSLLPTDNFTFLSLTLLLSSQCQTQRTSNLKSQAQSEALGFTLLFLLLQCLAPTALPTLAGAAVSRPKSRGLLVYGRPGRPPEPYPHLPTVELGVEDVDVRAGMASSSWATKEGQSLSTMGQLLLAAIFTRAKAAAMAELQVLSSLILAQSIYKANKS